MSVIFFIKTTFNSDLNHILNCVNKCDFGTKCFAKVEHFVLRLIQGIPFHDVVRTDDLPYREQREYREVHADLCG